MKTLARTFYKIQPTVMFFTVVPVFYFLFVLAYNPFGISDFLSAGQGRYTLNLIICTLIVLGVMVVSRMLLYLLRRLLDLNWSLYILWCTGEVVVIGLFTILLTRFMRIAWEALDLYGALICVGFIGMFVFQIFENIAMTMGMMPVTGITLPFLSYGGTSILGNMLALGLILDVGIRSKTINF